jgi:hypothetical protein
MAGYAVKSLRVGHQRRDATTIPPRETIAFADFLKADIWVGTVVRRGRRDGAGGLVGRAGRSNWMRGAAHPLLDRDADIRDGAARQAAPDPEARLIDRGLRRDRT